MNTKRIEKLLALKYNIEMLLEAEDGNTLNKLRNFVQNKPKDSNMWKHILTSISNKLSEAALSLKTSIFGHMESKSVDQALYAKLMKKLNEVNKEINELKNKFEETKESGASAIKIIIFGFLIYTAAKVIMNVKEVGAKLPDVMIEVKNGIVKSFKNLFESSKPLAERVFEFISSVILSPFEVAFKSVPEDLFKHLLNVGALTFGVAIIMLIL
jgi:predicted RNase H-like nuclease (RuvC/YqgF family)